MLSTCPALLLLTRRAQGESRIESYLNPKENP
jgi:hypothetical protein